MNILRLLFTAVLVSLSLTVHASSHPSEAGMDAAKLAEIPKRMQEFVDKGVISGAVTLVARNGQIASLEATGHSDLANGKAMRADNLFWIASMTKPVTATAILMLQDEGKLSVEDPVEKYLPEYANLWLTQERTKDSLSAKRPERKLTLRDLLTHTSGLAENPGAGRELSLAELSLMYSQQPLLFPPGSKWQYCNPGINVLGRIVEVASGQKYSDFLDQRIFKPLGMKDTTFYPTPSQLKRVAKSYTPAADGKGLVETNVWFLKGDLTSRERTAFPAGGLFSTAEDMCRFYQMVLDGGTYKGKRIVTETSVKLMTRTQTGEIKTGFTEGMSFGFGWAVVKEPTGITGMLSKGTFGHGGAYGTQGWVDPEKKTIIVLMIQRARLQNSDGSEIRRAFQDAAFGAILK